GGWGGGGGVGAGGGPPCGGHRRGVVRRRPHRLREPRPERASLGRVHGTSVALLGGPRRRGAERRRGPRRKARPLRRTRRAVTPVGRAARTGSRGGCRCLTLRAPR